MCIRDSVYTDWIAKDSAAQDGSVVKDYVIDGNACLLYTSARR